MNKSLFTVLLILLLGFAAPVHAQRIICASTTSTQNSGLYDVILPLFTKATGIEVHVVAVGTGAALELGKNGDADVLLVHAKPFELQLVQEGYFVNRHDVMYNDFVIIGPRNDPAAVSTARSVSEALKRIYDHQSLFISRGDDSGTHKKEQELWKESGLSPRGAPWYLEVGQGMSKTQRIANEKQAYTLTDRGTWLAKKDELDMRIVLEGHPPLFNQYGAMAVNPERYKDIKFKEANIFINWLISEEGQRAIASVTVNGQQLFIPNAE